MNFETKIIKTIDWRKSWYGKISWILFGISIIVIYFLRPGLFNRDFISDWFGQYAKPFLVLNFLFNMNGIWVMFTPYFKHKTIGNITITDDGIYIIESSNKKEFNTSEINSVTLKYKGHKKSWNSWLIGNLNFLDIVDKHNETYSCEFIINSNKHKQDLICKLLVFKKQGINIKVDYFTNYLSDIDFQELISK